MKPGNQPHAVVVPIPAGFTCEMRSRSDSLHQCVEGFFCFSPVINYVQIERSTHEQQKIVYQRIRY